MAQAIKPIENLIEEFNKLPGIGPKSSERFVYYLLQQPDSEIKKLIQAIEQLKNKVKRCSLCLTFSEIDPCPLCRSSQRDSALLCVIAQPTQIQLIEKTGEYNGLYFVLGGVLNPIDGITPEHLNIKQLMARIKNSPKKISEVILALNPDVEGESTSIYLFKILQPYVNKITRLGKGMPVGGDLDYADEITLQNALKSRN